MAKRKLSGRRYFTALGQSMAARGEANPCPRGWLLLPGWALGAISNGFWSERLGKGSRHVK